MVIFNVQIHVHGGSADLMSNERIRRLAERIKEKQLREQEKRQLELLRSRVLNSRAGDFWKEFVIQLSAAADELRSTLGTQWDNFTVSGEGWNKVNVSKHESPYLSATLEIDVGGARIRGTYKRAPVRPTTSSLPEQSIVVDLKVDGEHQIFGVIGDKPQKSIGDLAGAILELLLEDPKADTAVG